MPTRRCTAALLAAAVVFNLLTAAAGLNATLVLLPKTAGSRAKCLDGSPPGVYIRDSGAKNASWIVAIDGGGWCFNETSCYDRSLTALGSSASWAPTRTGLGIESDDCASNPVFCDYNVALVPYCDGFSQLGSRDDPIVFQNATFKADLWARGLDNLEATIAYLLVNTSFAAAKSVIVDGCSAGGMSSYHHLDRVAAALPPAVPVRGVGDAGFFADLPVLGSGLYYYRSLLTYYFPMHNGSAGCSQRCLADRPAEDAWQCAMAPVAVSYLQHPTFVIQSQWDGYQLGNVFAPPWLPGVDASWGPCAGDAARCSASQNNSLLYAWLPGFRGALAAAGVLGPAAPGQPGHGLFLHSCFIHCQWGSMHQFAIGGTSMYAAFAAWAGGAQVQLVDPPCLQCNPTCAAAAAGASCRGAA